MSGIVFSVELTGAPDGLSDLALRVDYLNMTLRASTSSSISVVVDYDQLDDITARSNGAIVVYKEVVSQGNPFAPDVAPVEVKRANFSDLRMYRGAIQRSATMGGTTTVGFAAGVPVTLEDVVKDTLLSDGRRVLEVSPFNDVKPGDTVTYNAVATVIEEVAYSGDADGMTMTLTEVAA